MDTPPPNNSFPETLFDIDERQIVDLTYPFDEKTLSWPGETPFSLKTLVNEPADPGPYCVVNEFTSSEHVGTHIDAPRHMIPGGAPVDALSLTSCMGRGMMIDVSLDRAGECDFQISVPLLMRWETHNGEIPQNAILLFRTGLGDAWGNRKDYFGTREKKSDAAPSLHFPGLHPEATRWLVENRHPKAIGIDTPSIDSGQSQTHGTHAILLSKSIPIFENVANLNQLPATGFSVIALPMKIRGGSGAPLRIVAILDQKPKKRRR